MSNPIKFEVGDVIVEKHKGDLEWYTVEDEQLYMVSFIVELNDGQVNVFFGNNDLLDDALATPERINNLYNVVSDPTSHPNYQRDLYRFDPDWALNEAMDQIEVYYRTENQETSQAVAVEDEDDGALAMTANEFLIIADASNDGMASKLSKLLNAVNSVTGGQVYTVDELFRQYAQHQSFPKRTINGKTHYMIPVRGMGIPVDVLRKSLQLIRAAGRS